jgi:hypothetical protein
VGALDWANLDGHRVGAADRHGRPPAKPKLANDEAQLGKPSMGMGVSPRGEARGGLAQLPTGYMTGTTGAGLRRGRAAWAKRERERGCAKWDREASAGVGGAQEGKREGRARDVGERRGQVRPGVCGRATWPGISA